MRLTALLLLTLLLSPLAQGRVLAKGVFDGDHHDAELVRDSTLIPAKLGTLFGFRFEPDPRWESALELQVVVQHPPMPPLGHDASGWVQYLLPGQPNTVLWEFEFEEELQAGEWVIYLMLDDEPLYMERFEVVLIPDPQYL
ncbi:DUF3859 domain-containing protein [Ferrimonas balearica]|uniref:DUF3859 domain-containing protein n=1 Tax=Ferrimonas balearica TaxID=44012 RepID=UPI001C99A4EB|nr:DUF3859 domain-containing protein [Ferrimonas balearica]MBY5994052.1 DUF3859 domain-containing protein [Ferrimonas balearica]